MNSGVYTITNKVNGKIYVGCTSNLNERRLNHLASLRIKTHDNDYLQKAWNKYGEENFEFEILEECEEFLLYSIEHYWTLLLRANERKFGYNIKSTHPYKANGRITEEIKRKISKGNKGKKRSEDIKRKYSEAKKGKPGHKQTEETRKKISKNHIGIKHTKETREKLAEINTGKKKSQSSLEKQVKTRKENSEKRGFYHSKETSEKIRIKITEVW